MQGKHHNPKLHVASLFLAALAAVPLSGATAAAQQADLSFVTAGRDEDPRPGLPSTRVTYQSWMSTEVADAWKAGYLGQGVNLTFVDEFSGSDRLRGNLGTGELTMLHGEWTRLQGSMIAPRATIRSKDYYGETAVRLYKGLNVLNLSYGWHDSDMLSLQDMDWTRQEGSIISYAQLGSAVVVKAAGNDAVAVDAPAGDGTQDFLNLGLIGGKSVLFVGSLSDNGTAADPASMADYSNFAGSDLDVQSHFLVVGVQGDATNLYGTSFAAPIVSGYAAILGSKFKKATPTQIVNQLLDTARTDTLMNYDESIYGQGEASLSRALAPRAIR